MDLKVLNKILNMEDMKISDIINELSTDENELFDALFTKLENRIYVIRNLGNKGISNLINTSEYLIKLFYRVDCNYIKENFNKYMQYTKKVYGRLMNEIEIDDNELLVYLKDNMITIHELLSNINNEKNISNNKKYEFLIQVIREVKDIDIIRNIINKYPYYTNLNNDDEHIVTTLFEKYSNLIMSGEKQSIILYYENIIDLFLNNDRVKLNNKNKKKIKIIINDLINYINKNGSRGKNKKILSSIELLNLKLLRNNISQENLNLLEEKYDINSGFTKDSIKELNVIIKNYENIIMPIITIDDKHVTCMDDAFQIIDNKNYITLNVYIADAGNLIKKNSFIDKDAFDKFANIYLPGGGVITMLPSELSNNLFSLNTNGKKKVIKYSINFDKDLNIIDYKISSDLIQVDRNLNNYKIDKILNNQLGVDNSLDMSIKLLNELSMRLRNNNKDKYNYRMTSDIIKKIDGKTLCKNEYLSRTKSEIITEEIMVLINYLSALICKENNLPFIYRTNKKLKDVEEFKKLVQIINDKEEIDIVLDGYAKSTYSSVPLPHDGLSKEVYSHSSSPLRRYPDLVNQRILNDLIINKDSSMIKYWSNYVEENIDEFNSKEERNYNFLINSIKMKKLVKEIRR